jgi:undecaprenyl-diphosphatase
LIPQLLQTFILGLIQGISEWLPISSTAHLKLAEYFFGLTVTPLFNLILHFGTVSVLIFYFRKDVKNILAALVHLDFKSEDGMLIPRIVVATIPTAIVGLTYNLFLTEPTSSLYVSGLETIPVIAVTFLIGATIVYSTKFAKEDKDYFSYKMVLIMGLAQGFAIFPGLSRSGVTISMALLLGLQRKKAFKFSFLLSIPAVLGDLAVEAYTNEGQFATGTFNPLGVVVGVAAAVIVGYLSLRLIARVVQGKKFHYFAYYTWALGILLLILTWLSVVA